MQLQRLRQRAGATRTGLARGLSKLGICSRSQARVLIENGRVRVNGITRTDPESPVNLRRDRIEVDEERVRPAQRVYAMLNKPRGLVTTAQDEKGRPTVFKCFEDARLPFVAPVGRLDQASEGLLLFTNDSEWAAAITAPSNHLDKVYHVQINCLPDATLLERIQTGVNVDGDFLAVKQAHELRRGTRNGWLVVVLDEGRNRHLRRLLGALGIEVLRLVRVSIGPLALGDLPKGQFRHLTALEIEKLRLKQSDNRPGGAAAGARWA